ncbi:hypothetical protein Aperf_G00000071607 [Anoplocephala perfoliata]
MTESPGPEKLVHIYDELTEEQRGVPTSEYRRHLIRWGVDNKVATQVCSMVDPTGTGYVKRDALCEGLNCYPNQPGFMKDVKLMESDMPGVKRKSVILLIVETVEKNKTKEDTLDEIIQRLEKIYGPGWNAYIADGRYWSICSHQQGSNLAFLYKDKVYGVYQSPGSE